jgi:hypothetical protein
MVSEAARTAFKPAVAGAITGAEVEWNGLWPSLAINGRNEALSDFDVR